MINHKAEEIKARTKRFALRILTLVAELPRNRACDVLSRQLVKCGTSVGANYRAACRARSRAEFIAKMGIVEEEADESIYWLEVLQDSEQSSAERVLPLLQEVNELLAITVASIRTAKSNRS